MKFKNGFTLYAGFRFIIILLVLFFNKNRYGINAIKILFYLIFFISISQSQNLVKSGRPEINSVDLLNLTPTTAEFIIYFSVENIKSEVWFEWGTTPFYEHSTPHVQFENVNSSFSVIHLSDLTPNTLYYYRGIVTNVYGRDENPYYFKTRLLNVTTFPVVQTTASSARFEGMCNPNGYSTVAYFKWKPVASPGDIWNETPRQYIGNDTTYQFFTDSISGLIPEVSYYVRAFAWTQDVPDGVSRGKTQLFTTLDDPNAGGFTIKITTKGANGYSMATPRKFGVHTHATYCIDVELGEYEVPPMPPSNNAEHRFIDLRSKPNACMGEGVYTDLRRYLNPAQADTYKYKIQAGMLGYPLEISWQELAANYSGSVRLVTPLNGRIVNVDMKSQSSYTLNDELNTFFIIAEGPKNVIWTKANIISADSAMIVGKFNPNGLPCEAWFEWGNSENYGNVTSKQNLGAVQNSVFFSEHLNLLQPNTQYYFRAVTKNQEGTHYSIDKTFITGTRLSVKEENNIPINFTLRQNYPNPFNPATTISFQLPQDALVNLKIYDILGRESATIVNEFRNAGYYKEVWDASEFSSGIYFYQLTSKQENGNTVIARKKLVIVK
ncbi:MAG: T9SS type A sorting domain-containing protein [Bacteroidota bacterium]|nr:T9SS type A sorting domain-containing protein [Bacteroidota bacterium]